MIATDEAAEKNDEAQKILAHYQAEADKQQTSLIQERELLQSDNAAAEKQRISAAQPVDPDDLTIYEKMRKRKAGVAVAKVRDKTCSACGSTLAASLNQAARSPSQMVFCDSCGRILYGA